MPNANPNHILSLKNAFKLVGTWILVPMMAVGPHKYSKFQIFVPTKIEKTGIHTYTHTHTPGVQLIRDS